MAVLYGADRLRAEKEMREALEFEFALANVSKLSLRNLSSKNMTN